MRPLLCGRGCSSRTAGRSGDGSMIAPIPHPGGAAREPHAITILPEVARRSQCSRPQDVPAGRAPGQAACPSTASFRRDRSYSASRSVLNIRNLIGPFSRTSPVTEYGPSQHTVADRSPAPEPGVRPGPSCYESRVSIGRCRRRVRPGHGDTPWVVESMLDGTRGRGRRQSPGADGSSAAGSLATQMAPPPYS